MRNLKRTTETQLEMELVQNDKFISLFQSGSIVHHRYGDFQENFLTADFDYTRSFGKLTVGQEYLILFKLDIHGVSRCYFK